jgi:VanZ family protein
LRYYKTANKVRSLIKQFNRYVDKAACQRKSLMPISGAKIRLLFIIALFSAPICAAGSDTLLPAGSPAAKFISPGRLAAIQGAGAAAAFTGLYKLWYQGHEQSSFRFFDDSQEWGQMDKLGHSYSTYWLSAGNTALFRKAGLGPVKACLAGTSISLGYMAMIEVLDGFSAAWGASAYDLMANASGALLFAGQDILMGKQTARLKYSFAPSPYAKHRPELLGRGLHEQMIKDYNGQTYWLSIALKDFVPARIVPGWLCLSAGYSISGFTGGHSNYDATLAYRPLADSYRQRHYYISFDADLSRIQTKRKWLAMLLKAANCLKMPAPALEISRGELRLRYLHY